MVFVALQEFKSLFKTVRTIVLTLIIASCSIGIGSLVSLLTSIEADTIAGYYMAVSIVFAFSGLIFIAIQSHQIFSLEVENSTIRLLLTKVSRLDIVLGKYLGIVLYWIIMLLIQYFIIFIKTSNFYFELCYSLIAFISFGSALTILISSIFRRSIHSNFASLIITISFTVLFIRQWSNTSEDFSKLLFFFPQTYLIEYPQLSLIPLLISLILLGISYTIIRKRDY